VQQGAQVLIRHPSLSGHIPGTSHRDLPRIDENRRDLNRTSDRMRRMFTMVRETPAQDPAYRSAHPPYLPVTCGDGIS